MMRSGQRVSGDIERLSAVANGEFGLASRLAARRAGWDPYEVWRTRVKEYFTEPEEHRRSRRSSEVVGARRGTWRRHVDGRVGGLLSAWRRMPILIGSKGDVAGL